VPAPKSLRDLRRSNVSGFQIGVISPYRKQVQKLQRLLDRNGPSGVQV
jgi:superfamily I DNA and/or RNA helicase